MLLQEEIKEKPIQLFSSLTPNPISKNNQNVCLIFEIFIFLLFLSFFFFCQWKRDYDTKHFNQPPRTMLQNFQAQSYLLNKDRIWEITTKDVELFTVCSSFIFNTHHIYFCRNPVFTHLQNCRGFEFFTYFS